MNQGAANRYLVTGATGFVGSHLTRRLIAAGCEVHVVVRPESRLQPLSDCRKQLTVHTHDGSTDGLLSILQAARPTTVCHLAASFQSTHGPEHIVPLIQSNVLFTAQLLEAMTTNGCYRLIHTGTTWQHYENADYNPVCLYAASKQACADIIRYYTEATPLAAITLELSDTYGPNDPRPKLFSLLRKARMDFEPVAMSLGEQLLDLVYIDDVIAAYLAAVALFKPGIVNKNETYAVSSHTPIRLRDVVSTYQDETGTELRIKWGGRPYREREVMSPWDRGRTLPHWHPHVDLRTGIRLMEGLPLRLAG